MIENYYIQIIEGRAERTGHYEFTRNGNRREITKYKEEYKTKAGTLSPEEWSVKLKAEIVAAGENDILECIKAYCKKHFVWIRTEEKLEEYALNIHAGRVYRYWSGFPVEEVEMVFFVG